MSAGTSGPAGARAARPSAQPAEHGSKLTNPRRTLQGLLLRSDAMTVGPSLFKPAHRPSGSVSKDRKRRVLIVDDHPIVRQGLRRPIEGEADLGRGGEAGTARAATAPTR